MSLPNASAAALLLAACAGAPPAADTGAPASWPTVDTTAACPAVDFAAAGSFALTRDVVYDVEDGEDLLLDLYTPDTAGPRPAVVMVHGGGFTAGSRGYMDRAAEHFAASGFVVLNVEYRRFPAVNLDDLVRDVVCSVKWGTAEADALGIAPGCIGTMGESAGGYLVSMTSLAGTDPAFRPSRMRGSWAS
jgi:pectinesterase